MLKLSNITKINSEKNFDILNCSSPHFSERNGAKINAIILHCVGVELQEIVRIFDDRKVSAHYVVPQVTAQELIILMKDKLDNHNIKFPNAVPVIQLVNCDKKAFHAGISRFSNLNNQIECLNNLNSSTIGIEFHSPGYANGDDSDLYKFAQYTNEQIQTGIKLISYLMKIYNIPYQNLLAHSTIAVGRKTDPGPLFFWKKLAMKGLGYIPKPKYINFNKAQEIDKVKFIQNKLFDIGFVNCPKTEKLDELTLKTIDSYIMQFAPELWNGPNNNISQKLINSLNGFDIRIIA